MALTYTPAGEIGSLAPAFSLPAIVRGEEAGIVSLKDFSGSKALLVAFICNHCPYVKAIQERLNLLAQEYQPRGAAIVAINPNDAVKYPDDSWEAMKQRSRELGYVFPYLQDVSQDVARAYGAVCTPDFFLYSSVGGAFKLSYRGRLDDNWKDTAAVTRRDLASALDQILSGRATSITEQVPSMGCSIKWKS